jgi:hypothetical protein
MERRKVKGLFIMSTTAVNVPFTMTPNAVLFNTSLSGKARLLWSVLEHFSGEHRTCWPGYATLAEKVGCSARWIPELLKELVGDGLVHVQPRQGRTNIYTLMARVGRQKGTQEPNPPPPTKPSSHEQKQPTKTNDNRAYRRLNERKKGPISFDKYLPGGAYPASVIS